MLHQTRAAMLQRPTERSYGVPELKYPSWTSHFWEASSWRCDLAKAEQPIFESDLKGRGIVAAPVNAQNRKSL